MEPAGTRDLLQNPLIADIGARLGKSVAQVVLRWQLQHGALPIPKSSNSERQRQNLAVFDFNERRRYGRHRHAGQARRPFGRAGSGGV